MKLPSQTVQFQDIVIIMFGKNYVMGFKKGIHKCVECEKKLKDDPDDTGMCSKCGAAETRLEKTIYKELIDDGNFP